MEKETTNNSEAIEFNEEVRSISRLEEIWNEIFLTKDKGALRLFVTCVVANQLDLDPVWIQFIAPPSSGKTEMIDSLKYVTRAGKPLVFPISDLTVNTFASGANKGGKDSSLLKQFRPGSIVTMKDYTSMIAKEPIAQRTILSQFREIYDGEYVKRTGNNKNTVWSGKIGVIAGCTQVIYQQAEEFAAMGDRFVMYQIEQPDSLEALKKVYTNAKDGTFKKKKERFYYAMKSYLEWVFDHLDDYEETLDLSPSTVEDLMTVVNFTTQVSSGIIVNSKKDNRVEFVPSKTMPMRMFKQGLSISKTGVFLNKLEAKHVGQTAGDDLTEIQLKSICKLAFDSIPITRRMALEIVTKYELGTTTAGLATALGYQTPVVAGWMAQLNGLGIVRREKDGVVDKWFLKQEHLQVMVKYQGIIPIAATMEDDDSDSWDMKVKAFEPSANTDWMSKVEEMRAMEEDPYSL